MLQIAWIYMYILYMFVICASTCIELFVWTLLDWDRVVCVLCVIAICVLVIYHVCCMLCLVGPWFGNKLYSILFYMRDCSEMGRRFMQCHIDLHQKHQWLTWQSLSVYHVYKTNLSFHVIHGFKFMVYIDMKTLKIKTQAFLDQLSTPHDPPL